MSLTVAIELAPVSPDLRGGILALTAGPGQERFAGRPAENLAAAERDPDRLAVAILEDDAPVGVFVLHRGPGADPPAAQPGDVLLRGLLVDAGAQNRGVATRALPGLRGFVARHMPGARRIVLGVNVRNPAAIRVYLRTGFRDTGALYLGGAHGPQHVFALEL